MDELFYSFHKGKEKRLHNIRTNFEVRVGLPLIHYCIDVTQCIFLRPMYIMEGIIHHTLFHEEYQYI